MRRSNDQCRVAPSFKKSILDHTARHFRLSGAAMMRTVPLETPSGLSGVCLRDELRQKAIARSMQEKR